MYAKDMTHTLLRWFHSVGVCSVLSSAFCDKISFLQTTENSFLCRCVCLCMEKGRLVSYPPSENGFGTQDPLGYFTYKT